MNPFLNALATIGLLGIILGLILLVSPQSLAFGLAFFILGSLCFVGWLVVQAGQWVGTQKAPKL